jgi:hypothetical protein
MGSWNMVKNVFDLIPSEDEIDRRLCVAERERSLLLKLLRLAREADRMRQIDAVDRRAIECVEME